MINRIAAAALVVFAHHAWAADATVTKDSTAAEAAPVEVRASAREEYRLRYSPDPDQSSQDVRLNLDLGVTDPTGHFLGAANLGLFWNVRRAIESGTTDAMGTVSDARNPFFDLYQLIGEYRGAGLVRVARLGRQTAEHGRPATFDGAYVLLRPSSAVSLFTFGGRSAHFYDIRHAGTNTWDDWMASVGAGYRPLSTLRFEVDYRLMYEQVQDRSLNFTSYVDHSYGLSAWLRPSDTAWARFTLRGLKSKFAEASASGHLYFTQPGLGLDAKVLVQPVTLNELDELDNPFYLTLGPSLPHARWRLDASRVFPLKQGSWEAHLGWNGRRLLYDSETPFNRNTARVYLLAAVRDVGLTGLTAQASVERLTDSAIPLVGRGIFTVNASAAYTQGRVRGELGTQYYRYQYNYYRDVEEVADVRAVFAEVRVKALDWLSVRAHYQVEFFDRTRHTFTASLAQTY